MTSQISKIKPTKRPVQNARNCNNIFGPSLKESKPLQVKCSHIKKLIHYDCNNKKWVILKKMTYQMRTKFMLKKIYYKNPQKKMKIIRK